MGYITGEQNSVTGVNRRNSCSFTAIILFQWHANLAHTVNCGCTGRVQWTVVLRSFTAVLRVHVALWGGQCLLHKSNGLK